MCLGLMSASHFLGIKKIKKEKKEKKKEKRKKKKDCSNSWWISFSFCFSFVLDHRILA